MYIPQAAFKYIKQQRTNIINPLRYTEQMEADFERIKPFLPEKVDAIVDIGCGVGGIDVLLAKHYKKAKLFLMDGDGDNPTYGFGDCDFYNSSEVTSEVMKSNGVRDFEMIPIGDIPECDLIISLYSWGYHYPVDTYIKDAVIKCKDRVILDIFKGRDGKGTIRQYFRYIGEVEKHKHGARLVYGRSDKISEEA